MTKRYAVYLREKPAFQVVREAQYAFEAYELARAELATKWEDYSIGFADCEVVDVEEQSRARAARRVGAERGARA
jgi:hypothetical protein